MDMNIEDLVNESFALTSHIPNEAPRQREASHPRPLDNSDIDREKDRRIHNLLTENELLKEYNKRLCHKVSSLEKYIEGIECSS